MHSGAPSESDTDNHHRHCQFVAGGREPMEVADEQQQQASSKSWAKQIEESYQLQLELALRLSSQSASTDDPNLLGLGPTSSSSSSPQAMSHRFWVLGILFFLVNE